MPVDILRDLCEVGIRRTIEGNTTSSDHFLIIRTGHIAHITGVKHHSSRQTHITVRAIEACYTTIDIGREVHARCPIEGDIACEHTSTQQNVLHQGGRNLGGIDDQLSLEHTATQGHPANKK